MLLICLNFSLLLNKEPFISRDQKSMAIKMWIFRVSLLYFFKAVFECNVQLREIWTGQCRHIYLNDKKLIKIKCFKECYPFYGN